MAPGDLLLMDVGAEYEHYSADVTRTFPVNGRFSPAQAAVYQIVYDAQEAVAGASIRARRSPASTQAGTEVIKTGLLLDEPAAGLDLGGREDLVARLGLLAQDTEAPALVLVTHHVEEIPPGFADVLLLREGRVVAAGPLKPALTAENLRRRSAFRSSSSGTATGGALGPRARHGLFCDQFRSMRTDAEKDGAPQWGEAAGTRA